MKTIKTLLIGLIALFSVQIAQAQCTGTVTVTGTDPTFTFTNSNANATSSFFLWDFGDGSGTNAGSSTSHTYSSNGTFTVVGTYIDSLNGCIDNDTVFVTVTSQTGGCNANFSIGGNGPSYFFTPNVTPSSPVGYYHFEWNFGDGSAPQTTTTMNPISHSYSSNGIYNVQCILFDSIFCSDTVIMTLTVTNASGSFCDASFIWYDTNGTVNFLPVNPDTSVTYAWTFGDGTTSTLMNPSHTYNPTGSGVYQTCLTISSATCSDTYCDTINLNNSPGGCDASFSFSLSGSTSSFTASYPTSGATYLWSFGDGTSSTQQNPTHTYPATGAGIFTACLTITDSAGTCTDNSCSTIIINQPSNNNIYGFVQMGNNPADSGVVFLIEYDSTLGTLTAVDTTMIDSIGSYIFTNVSAGSYLIKAALSPASSSYSSYLPTYYAQGTPAMFGGELLWSNADFASSPNNTFYGINLVAGTNPGGAGFVGGLVSQGANKVGDPISDILVIVTDMNGNPLAYEYSDNTGSFSIDNLPYGDYVLYPEVYGKTTTPMNFTLSSSNSTLNNFKIEVNSQTVIVSIVSGITPVQEFSDVVLYPNPVQNQLNIDFGKTVSQEIIIEMFDVAGRRISVQKSGSTKLVKINTAKLNGGVYLIKLSNTDGEQVFRFVK